MMSDIRYALRVLLKNRGFAIVAILTLALGTGATTAIFTVLNAVLLETLPVRRPEELVLIRTHTTPGGVHSDFSYPLYVDFRDRNDVFAGVAAYSPTTFGIATGDRTDRVFGEYVTSNYFSVVGANPALGHGFTGRDELEGGQPVAVISHALWQRAFNRDPHVIGKTIRLNGRTFSITGVAPRGFTGVTRGSQPDVWITVGQYAALDDSPGIMERRTTSWLFLLGRLKPGVALQPAQARMSTVARRFNADMESPNWRVDLASAAQGDAGRVSDLERPLQLLMGAVLLIFLIATANVASLLVARARARHAEIGLRMALGATRLRVMWQLLVECLVLAIAGGAVGLVIAAWTTSLLTLRTAFGGPLALDLSMDARVFAFALTLSVIGALLFGTVPAWRAAGGDLVEALKTGRDPSASRRPRGRQALVAVQIALSVVLLVGAAVFLRSLGNLYAIETGFAGSADRVVAGTLDLQLRGYDENRGKAFHPQLVAALERVPGVQSVSLASALPVSAGGTRLQRPPNFTNPPLNEPLSVDIVTVTPRFFETVGLPLVAGRDFRTLDDARGAPVIIVNETMAKRLWPKGNAVGSRFISGEESWEVIGVARDTKYRSLRERPRLTMYRPLAQFYRSTVNVVIRTNLPAGQVMAGAHAALRSLDPALPLFNVRTLAEHVDHSLYADRLRATLLAAFALLALALAGIGAYGVMSYAVSQRTREIGIRMALGARRGAVISMVLRSGLAVAIAGVAAGSLAAFWLVKTVAGQLYGVTGVDAAALLSAWALLLAVATLANYVPARRAARVNPVTALRSE